MTRTLLMMSLAFSACFKPWSTSGPWACEGDVCPSGFVCDDGVCCVAGGTPACPTLPVNGSCVGAAGTVLYRDRDGDGSGDPASSRLFCSEPLKEHWVSRHDDCDDTNATIAPGVNERCNGVDDDCDGVIDNGTQRTTWYVDVDSDGYGRDCDAGCRVLACAEPAGYAPRAGDCAPDDATRFPGALERCNNADDNCNGIADDAPFSDVEYAGSDGGQRFDCTTNQPGSCAEGARQCVYEPTAAASGVVCVPRAAPQTDVCGDGVDNDCDGFIDDAPGCGGPTSVLSSAGSVVAVKVFASDTGTPSGLPRRCLAHEPGAQAMAWLNPSWVGSGGVARHVWALEAPAGLAWDVSGATSRVVLDLRLASFVHPADQGWGDFANPVVTLCGERAGEYERFVPNASDFNGTVARGYSQVLPIGAPPTGWTLEMGPVKLDRKHVKSLEIVVSPAHPTDGGTVTFTLVFGATTGFAQ